MDKALINLMFEEVQRRMVAERAVHDQASTDLSHWLTIAAGVLGGLVFLLRPTLTESPVSVGASFRLLLMIVTCSSFAAAVWHMKQFFAGQDIPSLADPMEWIRFGVGLANDPDAERNLTAHLVNAYGGVASQLHAENEALLARRLKAKAWLAGAAIGLALAFLAHTVA